MRLSTDGAALATASRATRLLFVLVGIGTAAWAPLVPFVKERAGLDADALGLLLLCLGIGSLVAMPASGALAARFGYRSVLAGGTAIAAAALPFLASLASPLQLCVALAAYGVGLGAVDCAMNLQAIDVEKAAGRPMMSGFHGFFSLGCILGSLLFAGLLWTGLGTLPAALVTSLLLAISFGIAWPGILSRAAPVETGAGPRPFPWPRGRVWLLGLLCFIVFLTEGQALDWSAVFLRDHRGIPASAAGLGFAAFSVAMTIGRFLGDAIVLRIGPVAAMAGGGILAALGLAVVTGLDHPALALAGYALVGAGCANIVPVLFTAAGNRPDVPASVAIPAVTTMGYAGLLAGPAAIGFVAAATSLPIALAAISALLLGLAACAPLVRR